MSALTLPPPPAPDTADLALLLAALVERVGAGVPDVHLRAAATEAGPAATEADWPRRLDLATAGVGLRLRWTRATAADAAALSHPDLPLVTCRPGPGGPRWVVLAGRRLGRATVQVVDDPRGPQAVRPGALAAQVLDLDAETALPWALVEPSLPAAPVQPRAEGAAAPTPLARLGTLLRAERPDLGAVVVYAVAIGLLSLATPLAMQVLINWLAFGALQQPVVVLTGVLFACLALAAGLHGLQRIAVEVVQRRIFVRTVTDLATRLTRVRVTAFDQQYGPELLNRFFDVLTIQKAVAKLTLDGVGAALQALVGLVLLAFYHPALLAFDVAVVGAVLFVLFGLGRGAGKTAISESKAKYEVAAWLEELARHPLLFKVTGGDALALERADALARDYLTAREGHWRIYFRQYAGVLALRAVATVGLLGLAGWLVLDGQLTLGQLVAAEFIVTAGLAGLARFAGKLDTWYDLLAGIDKLGQLVDLPQERATGSAGGDRQGPAAVALRGACYADPGGPTRLGPLDLDVPAGARLAVLGDPGAGKSTLADLLLGVRPPTRGEVERDGLDLGDLRPAVAWREAMLARGVDLFRGSIAENVALVDAPGSIPAVRRALAAVGLTEAVARLPAGLDTPLGPSGSPLSTGEAVRLVLARALWARPRLLVVDGLLDAVPAADRTALLAPLLDPRAPWTLVLLTEDPALAARLPHRLTLTREGPHA